MKSWSAENININISEYRFGSVVGGGSQSEVGLGVAVQILQAIEVQSFGLGVEELNLRHGLQIRKTYFDILLVALAAPKAVSARHFSTAGTLALDLGCADSLAEAGDVEVVFTGGFEDGAVLLADITFVIFIAGGFPDGGLRVGDEGLLLLETLEFVDEEAGDDDDDSGGAGDED